jgi:hypothetical protein
MKTYYAICWNLCVERFGNFDTEKEGFFCDVEDAAQKLKTDVMYLCEESELEKLFEEYKQSKK